MSDLNTTIQQLEEALGKTPANHPSRARRHHGLGAVYYYRYQDTQVINDLNIAIQQYQEALNKTPVDHPDQASRLQDLGVGYHDRYEALRNITDLDAAIQQYQEALNKTPVDDPDQASRLHRLGLGYLNRYEAIGAITDLNIAIQQYQEALDKAAADDFSQAVQLHSLGIAYGNRYYATGAIADLNTAIELVQKSLNKAPANDFDQTSRFTTLGKIHYDKYEATRAIADLDIAIHWKQEALNKTRIDHPHRASRFHGLGKGYYHRYHAKGAIADLETAIQHFQTAVTSTSVDHPDRASLLHGLGAGYYERYCAKGAIADLEIASQHFQEALENSRSLVSDRLLPGMNLLALHADAKNWREAFQTAFKTISLVPILAPRSLEASDKQRLLVQVSGLASDAAAIALNATKTPFDAIQLLELGREVIAGSLNEIRADIFELQQEHPQLAEEYINLRNQLDTPKTLMKYHVDQRYNAGLKLEEKIQKIRKLPGFDRFLLAPSKDELRTAAKDGPIVVINISEYRCDALIIKNRQFQSLELPRLHANDIRDRTMGDLAAPKILEWLWETIAQPVLDTMGFTKQPSDGRWPRIWWIPTGPLSKFPLHAAGCHTNGSTETVLDRVISSYSSSIKAIIHGRRQRRNPQGTLSVPARALLIAMDHTPGSPPLPFARGEVEMLHGLCQSMGLESIEPGRRKQDIMSHLRHCNIFHFAGHGCTDDDDPSKSHLLLEDGGSDPLTVANLLELNLRERSPFLAYLSACGTGRIKGEKFVDENIHLISAYQLAGFRHVIGTLWEVNDQTCVDMARITYEEISKGGMTDESVCQGLHRATRELRDQWVGVGDARRGRKSVTTVDPPLMEDRRDTKSTSDEGHRDNRLPRTAFLCDEDEKPGLWVPYVHFGV
ncbi:hypothetical protein ACMFMG_005585 [Clarireedia jacksonii]